MRTSRCPECASDVIIDDEAYVEDLVDCANCGAELEINSLNPLRLSLANDGDGEDEIPE